MEFSYTVLIELTSFIDICTYLPRYVRYKTNQLEVIKPLYVTRNIFSILIFIIIVCTNYIMVLKIFPFDRSKIFILHKWFSSNNANNSKSLPWHICVVVCLIIKIILYIYVHTYTFTCTSMYLYLWEPSQLLLIWSLCWYGSIISKYKSLYTQPMKPLSFLCDKLKCAQLKYMQNYSLYLIIGYFACIPYRNQEVIFKRNF